MFDFISSIILNLGFIPFNSNGIGGNSILKRAKWPAVVALKYVHVSEITLWLCLPSDENDELAVIKVVGNNLKKPSGFWGAGQFTVKVFGGF